ncbi:MAG TPA: immunoglobulin domain-containing protein, partial [Candidatus Dormibacteraeota bacterium]|nr:immunoglobulin domain-containing protein [Candidatus Dormibacteraeota bacterium]
MNTVSHPSMRLLPLVLALFVASVARADFDPVPLTSGSYSFDIVVEKTAPLPLPYCLSASQGGGTGLGDSTWFEQGYWRSPNQNIGVPHPGQIFTHQSNGNITYQMPPTYGTNNGLLADSTFPAGGTLTLATPTTCVGISVFGSSGGGGGSANYTITHADTSTETGTLSYNDWFNGANPAWTTGGRVGTPNGGEQNNGNNPRLYSVEIGVSSASPVVSASFTYASGAHVAIYAISTSADGTTYTPAALGGFNQRLIVPTTFPLTATMDQGTNTADNGNLATWFESGYIATNLTYGLPPSGSTFNSQTQPTHHYQMGNYSGNNGVLIDANHLSATIVPASPAPYNAFALLTAGGNIGTGNRMTNLCIMQHADGVNETNTFYGYDWFEGSVPGFVAYTANGRVNMHDRTVNSLGGNNPKLFETYFTLADSASPVTNILLRFGSARTGNATTFVMAVSATAGGVPPVVLGQPSWLNAFAGTTAHFNMSLGAGTGPLSYFWQKGNSAAGPFVNLTDGGNISGSGTTNLTIANVGAGNAGYYQVVVTNAVGAATSSPPVALYILNSTATNVTLPADAISDSTFVNNAAPNTGEGVSNVVDRTTSKYLCYGSGPNAGSTPFAGPVGYIITPGGGGTVVNAMRIYTANDAPERDPADIMLEGSTDGGSSWTTLLADTALALPDVRNNGGNPLNLTNQVLQELDFPNNSIYTTYRVTINNVKTNSAAIGCQLAEIELLG